MRTWHHRHCTGILHLRSSSLHPYHGGSREPIRHIISILRLLTVIEQMKLGVNFKVQWEARTLQN